MRAILWRGHLIFAQTRGIITMWLVCLYKERALWMCAFADATRAPRGVGNDFAHPFPWFSKDATRAPRGVGNFAFL